MLTGGVEQRISGFPVTGGVCRPAGPIGGAGATDGLGHARADGVEMCPCSFRLV